MRSPVKPLHQTLSLGQSSAALLKRANPFRDHVDGGVQEDDAEELPETFLRDTGAHTWADLGADHQAKDQGEGQLGMKVSLRPMLIRGEDRRRHHDEQAGGDGGHHIEPDEHGEGGDHHRAAADAEKPRGEPGEESNADHRVDQPAAGKRPAEGETDLFGWLTTDHHCHRVEKEKAERDRQPSGLDEGGEPGSAPCAEDGGGHEQKADTNVDRSFQGVGNGTGEAGENHSRDARSDGFLNAGDEPGEPEERHHEDASADPEKTGDGADSDGGNEQR